MQLLDWHDAHRRPSRCGADDMLAVDAELERGAPFCSNPACALHVRLLDAEVEGGGNWVTLPDGRIFGRSRFGNTLLCDACGTRRGPLRMHSNNSGVEAPPAAPIQNTQRPAEHAAEMGEMRHTLLAAGDAEQ